MNRTDARREVMSLVQEFEQCPECRRKPVVMIKGMPDTAMCAPCRDKGLRAVRRIREIEKLFGGLP